MGWETRKGHGRYYTRSKRVGGRVVREYVGQGLAAELTAEVDQLAHRYREIERDERREESARLAAVDAELGELELLCQSLVRGALLVSGYHPHKGEWRRRRVRG
jgi:hypothetical protein